MRAGGEILRSGATTHRQHRERGADGKFYYSVATTGVYCRPSCAARLALRKNVRFHDTREDAERAGFRPCKRCKPDRPDDAGHAAMEPGLHHALVRGLDRFRAIKP